MSTLIAIIGAIILYVIFSFSVIAGFSFVIGLFIGSIIEKIEQIEETKRDFPQYRRNYE